MVRFLAASPSFCVCLCAQVTTQGHAGNDMVVNHTPQMVCVDLCVQHVCLYFSSRRVYKKWVCSDVSALLSVFTKSESSKWQLKMSLWMNSRQASRTIYVAHSETNSFYKSTTFMKYIRNSSIILSTALTTPSSTSRS